MHGNDRTAQVSRTYAFCCRQLIDRLTQVRDKTRDITMWRKTEFSSNLEVRSDSWSVDQSEVSRMEWTSSPGLDRGFRAPAFSNLNSRWNRTHNLSSGAQRMSVSTLDSGLNWNQNVEWAWNMSQVGFAPDKSGVLPELAAPGQSTFRLDRTPVPCFSSHLIQRIYTQDPHRPWSLDLGSLPRQRQLSGEFGQKARNRTTRVYECTKLGPSCSSNWCRHQR